MRVTVFGHLPDLELCSAMFKKQNKTTKTQETDIKCGHRNTNATRTDTVNGI